MTDPREPIGTEWVQSAWTAAGGERRFQPLELRVPEEPYATVDVGRSGMVIVWMLGAVIAALIVVIAALIVAVAWLAWTRP